MMLFVKKNKNCMNIYTRITILQFGMYETDILNISNNDRILLYYPSRFNKSFFIESLSTISQNFPYLLYASTRGRQRIAGA